RAVEDINFKFGTYGESMADMQKRLRKFLKYISKTYKDQTVVLCTHRHCVAVLLSIISGVSLNTVMDQMKSVKNAQIVSNSEIVKFLIDDDNVTYFGDNKNILELMSLKTHPKI
ncbi:MAG: histidine phosphatase family protein, partial [Candidatus Micrarchaeaceae archaeon]